jgi:hypothetical protein
MNGESEPQTEQRRSYTEDELLVRTMDALVDRDARYVDEHDEVGWTVAEIASISGMEALKA